MKDKLIKHKGVLCQTRTGTILENYLTFIFYKNAMPNIAIQHRRIPVTDAICLRAVDTKAILENFAIATVRLEQYQWDIQLGHVLCYIYQELNTKIRMYFENVTSF